MHLSFHHIGTQGGNSEVVCDVAGLNPDMLVITNTRRRRSVTSSPLGRTKRQDTSSGLVRRALVVA